MTQLFRTLQYQYKVKIKLEFQDIELLCLKQSMRLILYILKTDISQLNHLLPNTPCLDGAQTSFLLLVSN